MKKLPFFLVLLLILLLEIIISVDSQVRPPAVLQFVLRWPPTFCLFLNTGDRPARCKEPIPQREFTLHGLWPADADGESLTCAEQFKPPEPEWKQLFSPVMRRQLTPFWRQLRENSKDEDLWKHEWREHGACGGTTAEVYFNTAIKINGMIAKENLFNYTKTSGIIACDSLEYTQKDIVDAIQKMFIESSRSPPPPSPRVPPPPPPPPPRAPPPPRSPPPPPRALPSRSPPPPPRALPSRSPPPPPRALPSRSPPPPPRALPSRSPPPPRALPSRSPPPPPRRALTSPRSPPPPPPRAPPPPPALNVYLRCKPIPNNSTHIYLNEVILCTNLDGTSFVPCPSDKAPKTCKKNRIILPHPQTQRPRASLEETDGIYPMFGRSWAKETFNGWDLSLA